MKLSWSFLRLLLAASLVGSCLLEQATGEEAEDVARSLGVAEVNDWDIRSLYRVRFQHITKRPPPGHQRHAERKSNLATRWAALKERISDFFPSRHTNPRTVVTFDKIATDFVNVGIVKLAKALDPPKITPKRAARRSKKGRTSTPEPVEVSDAEMPPSTTPTPSDVRPKRRVTLLVDLADFDLQDIGLQDDADEGVVHISALKESTKPVAARKGVTTAYPLLPEAQMQVGAEQPSAGSTASVQGHPSKFLISASVLLCLLSVANVIGHPRSR